MIGGTSVAIGYVDLGAVDADELAGYVAAVYGYAVVLEPDAGSLKAANCIQRGPVLYALVTCPRTPAFTAVALAVSVCTGTNLVALRALVNLDGGHRALPSP